MDEVTKAIRSRSRPRTSTCVQLGPPPAGARHHGRRLRGARRPSPPAPLLARPRPAGAGEVRPGAPLLFDDNNIRYVTSTKIGECARQARADAADPWPGPNPLTSARAANHKRYSPWLKLENASPTLSACAANVDPAFA